MTQNFEKPNHSDVENTGSFKKYIYRQAHQTASNEYTAAVPNTNFYAVSIFRFIRVYSEKNQVFTGTADSTHWAYS